MTTPRITICYGDNSTYLKKIPDGRINLIYVDPPFNTGNVQARQSISTTRCCDGDRKGFAGNTYKTTVNSSMTYNDEFDDYLSFIVPRLKEAHRILADNGSLFVHLDYREVHYAKIELDKIFGRQNFINEIIWAYDFGARSSKKWSAKHDTILWYAKSNNYIFNKDEMDRIPYMAPGLVGPEKAARGKTPTDTWWHTIVGTNSHEKTGYPTQKPLGILNRIVKVHSAPDDLCLDFFAGSGSFGEACAINGRNCVLIDSNMQAIDVMIKRFAGVNTKLVGII